ncbi:error-prone DNA polymerase [Thioalkalivibrio thiocyanodenitrificans]|uniref:error-prone DNA polymerase n=1 Tax=Thioalkalivibrio thiocyanodenitrificans TaxID=243063 RepID=UPI000367DA23|nr:error-prone DNA polymerase [Thioalkalivibrio thiocyanodenitrificans]
MPPDYAELHCLSNFSFLRGASHPEELVARAAELGYRALALTDECSLAGVVRAHQAAKEHGLHLIIGTEVRLSTVGWGERSEPQQMDADRATDVGVRCAHPNLRVPGGCAEDALHLVLLAENLEGYENLSQLITTGRRNAAKGSYHLTRDALARHARGLLTLWLPPPHSTFNLHPSSFLQGIFPGRAWIAVALHRDGRDAAWRTALEALSERTGLPLAATGVVHMHLRERRALQDVLTAIRHCVPLSAAGARLFPNGERHLRPREDLARLYRPEWMAEAVAIAGRCRFSLDELRYTYPVDDVPPGDTAMDHLTRLTREGMAARWPGGAPQKVRDLVAHELAIIGGMDYAPYFLTVYDIVRFARGRGILCQGRGSAANSAVCYCLGVTAVDPSRSEMLFERFVSKERNEPPDIDVDFEHERREEVMQYIYGKYGRERAALAATLITYRRRSAIRDVGKALGLSVDQVTRLSGNLAWWAPGVAAECIREAGLDPDSPVLRRLVALVEQLVGFPRHLSQHVGGFVIARDVLSKLVPIENAAMAERTVIQWDKDDLDALGLLKIDVLALGMLSAVHRAFDLIHGYRDVRLDMATVPAEDPATYEMISRGDTVGVFQIESRAQMSMLPRLKPRCFYDLVIEIAIVRPGPIQGQMVHPYLRRRQGLDPVSYPSEAVRGVLERTLGVPIFQEQVIKLAMVAAGFSAGEADGLRRAIGAWRRKGTLHLFRERLLRGMAERGYPQDFAEQIYQQILGFGEYGFPESHSASFALIAYVSAWLKRHEPAAFTAALLNSQPMGFYGPSQLVQDARRHGVTVLPVDVCESSRDCTLEAPRFNGDQPPLRLGLRLVQGLGEAVAERIAAARDECAFANVNDLARRATLDTRQLDILADAGALKSLAGHRHRARWAALGVEAPLPLLTDAAPAEADPLLPAPGAGEDCVADYRATGLTLGDHPLALLRGRLRRAGGLTARELGTRPHGRHVRYIGLVITRQHPASANGTVFLTLEDETGTVNAIVWPGLVDRYRREVIMGRLLEIRGELQHVEGVMHLVARRLEDRSGWLGRLVTPSRDFC